MAKNLKTQFLVIGSGAAALLTALRLGTLGYDFILVNPKPEFSVNDLRPFHGLGVWEQAYRGEDIRDLPDYFDSVRFKVQELFPTSLEQMGFQKTEVWSILSRTPVHNHATEFFEREFFKQERKPWSAGHFRLVSPEHTVIRSQNIDFALSKVAQTEGAIIRSYGIHWDALNAAVHLTQFLRHRYFDQTFQNAKIKSRVGKKIFFEISEDQEFSVEVSESTLILLSGDTLPAIRNIVASCTEPWIQGIRKRRREQHFAVFETDRQKAVTEDIPLWIELGNTQYFITKNQTISSWTTRRGPDGFDRAIDEGFRLLSSGSNFVKLSQVLREFWLEWDWKKPSWRKTNHQTHWGTAFEGDLISMVELVWNLPLQSKT